MLDDLKFIHERDAQDALGLAEKQWQQLQHDYQFSFHPEREIQNVVVAGMGGSALAALIVKVLLDSDLTIPFDIIRGYDLPNYVNRNTLVIASSYSGNTEETLTALEQAEKKGAQLAILASGGKLIDIATNYSIAHVSVPGGVQPRMAMIYNLHALFAILNTFNVINRSLLDELEKLSGWLGRDHTRCGMLPAAACLPGGQLRPVLPRASCLYSGHQPRCWTAECKSQSVAVCRPAQ